MHRLLTKRSTRLLQRWTAIVLTAFVCAYAVADTHLHADGGSDDQCVICHFGDVPGLLPAAGATELTATPCLCVFHAGIIHADRTPCHTYLTRAPPRSA